MKRTRIFFLVLGLVLSFATLLYTNNEQALAARARCYVIAGSFGGAEVACDSSSVSGAFTSKGMTADNDHCYTFDGTNLNDVPCNQAPFTGPRCYVTSAYGGGFESCTNLSAAFAAKGWTALPGHCYIFDSLNLQDVDCNLPAFGGSSTTIAPISTTPLPPTTEPVTTGEAPNENNPDAPDPQGPAIERQANTGFEQVDDECNVGNLGQDCAVTDKLSAIANVLSIGVGIIIVIMIIVGGINYSMAGGDPGKVAQAKSRILNAIYALIAYFFLFAFLQWVVPGGIF